MFQESHWSKMRWRPGLRPEPRYNELTAIPRPPSWTKEGKGRGKEEETIEGWETHRERREQGKGKGGRGGEKGRGVPEMHDEIYIYFEIFKNFTKILKYFKTPFEIFHETFNFQYDLKPLKT